MSGIGSGTLDRILSQVLALINARRTGGKEKAAAASVVALVYLAVVFRQGKRPVLVCRRSGHNVRVLRALAGVIDRPYYPSWLTPNAHVNCLLGYAKRGITVSKTRELIRCWGELPISCSLLRCGQHVLVSAASRCGILCLFAIKPVHCKFVFSISPSNGELLL